MANIEIYSKGYCPFCKQTKSTFNRLGLAYKEYEITNNKKLTLEMRQRSQRTTVPQIFIDGEHIGGNSDLQYLLRSGGLSHLN